MSYLHSQQLVEFNTPLCEDCKGKLIDKSGFVVCDECGLINFSPIMQERAVLLHSTAKLSIFGLTLGRTYGKDNSGTYYVTKQFFIRALGFFQLPEHVKDRSAYLFKNILDYKKTFSSQLDLTKYYTYSIMAVSMLVAIRENKIPVTTQEVIEYFNSQNYPLTNKHINNLLQELHLLLPLAHPRDYLERALNPIRYLGDPPYELLDRYLFTFKFLSSCNPLNFAVACCCLAYVTQYNMLLPKLLKEYDNSRATIRNLIKQIERES